jgi:hypothetical protein
MTYPELLATLAVYFAAIFVMKIVFKRFTPTEPPPDRGRSRRQHPSFSEFRQNRKEKEASSQAMGAYGQHRRSA